MIGFSYIIPTLLIVAVYFSYNSNEQTIYDKLKSMEREEDYILEFDNNITYKCSLFDLGSKLNAHLINKTKIGNLINWTLNCFCDLHLYSKFEFDSGKIYLCTANIQHLHKNKYQMSFFSLIVCKLVKFILGIIYWIIIFCFGI